jgi:hypothetical protein
MIYGILRTSSYRRSTPEIAASERCRERPNKPSDNIPFREGFYES